VTRGLIRSGKADFAGSLANRVLDDTVEPQDAEEHSGGPIDKGVAMWSS
jgi:hypothetical protein